MHHLSCYVIEADLNLFCDIPFQNISYQQINPKAYALQALFLFHQMPPGKNLPLSTIHIDVFLVIIVFN